MEATRHLWNAVLLQAFEDLEGEPYGSYWHSQAVAFFFGSADWADSRRTICDMLGLDPSDLRAPALRIVNGQRAARGLSPLSTRPAAMSRLPKERVPEPAAAAPRPWPRLVAYYPEPVAKVPRGKRQLNKRTYNPFDPFRKLPSERADAAD